jgi:hypothetical protein
MRIRPFAPIAFVSLLAAFSLGLAACGGDSGDGDRQASVGPTEAWSGSTGNKAYGDFRGVEVEIINSRRVNDRPLIVGIAAEGFFCPPSPERGNPCRNQSGGTQPREVPVNKFARWKAYQGEIYKSVDANALGQFESTIEWNRGPGKANRVSFSVINPALARPYVRLYSDSSCPRIVAQKFALKEGTSETLTDDTSRCQVTFKVTRQGDTDEFKRYKIEVS